MVADICLTFFLPTIIGAGENVRPKSENFHSNVLKLLPALSAGRMDIFKRAI